MTRVWMIGVVLLALALPADARAEIAFAPCGTLECGSVTVPLDHSGAVPGTLSIAVYRARGLGQGTHRVLLGLPGGPGDSGRVFFERRLQRFETIRRTHDLVFIDPRGTGASGALRCDDATACAEALGPARHLYTSRDVAEDIELVRAALGLERLRLYGISYGTWFAQTYAKRHPDRVEAMVLDAPVSLSAQDDVFRTKLFGALPRALRAICSTDRCSKSAYRDVAAVIDGLARRPLTARVHDEDGRASAHTLDVATTALALSNLDVNPPLRAELPAAMAAARAGDGAPLARLVEAGALQPPYDPTVTSPGLNVVAQCEELGLPWLRTAPFEERMPEARRRLEAMPASAFAPVGRELALLASLAGPCERWPARAEDPLDRRPLPPVRTYVLSGEADLRTPAGDAEEIVRSRPGTPLLTVANSGHGAMVENPACAPSAVADWLNESSRGPGRCRAVDLLPRPAFARTLTRVPGASTREKTVNAAVLTATDALNQVAMRLDSLRETVPSVAFGGLRGGRVRGVLGRAVLSRARLVGGLEVSGTARRSRSHDLRVRGPLSGTLRIRGRRVTGTLGGRRIRMTLGSLTRMGAAGIRVEELI